MARWMIFAGAVLLALGIAWHYFPWLLNWFGRLPATFASNPNAAGCSSRAPQW